MSLSPDGLELLLDRVVTQKTEPIQGNLRTNGGSAIAQSSLMLLNLQQTSQSNVYPSPQPLSLQGFRPQWLP